MRSWLRLALLLASLAPLPASAQRALLLPDEAVGAQARPDPTFADQAPSGELHVAPGGSDQAAGTAQAPLRTINRAVRLVRPGQEILVHDGVYAERVSIVDVDGTAAAPIWLRAAPGARPVIRAAAGQPGASTMIRISRAFWVLEGLEIDCAGVEVQAVRIEGARNLVLRGLHAHHGTHVSGIAVGNDARDVSILDSHLHDFVRAGGAEDSHAIVIVPDVQRVRIAGNESHGNSGDSVQCVGPEGATGTAVSRDITIEDNELHHDLENAVDVKTCTDLTIRGNRLHGYRTKGAVPGGAPLVVHVNADRILIEDNRIWDSGMALAVGASNGRVGAVVFRRNRVFDLTTAANSAGNGVRAAPVRTLQLYDNTFVGVPGWAIRLGDHDAGPTERARVLNNVIVDAGRALEVNLPRTPGLVADGNLFWNAAAAPSFRIDGQATGFAGWQARGFDPQGLVADPLFVPAARATDFFTRPASPARDTALPGFRRFCGAGPDRGAVESCR